MPELLLLKVSADVLKEARDLSMHPVVSNRAEKEISREFLNISREIVIFSVISH